MTDGSGNTSSDVRWGFLGAGFIATKALAPAVHAADNAVLQVAGSRDLERAVALEPQWTTSDYDAVCSATDVDVVYIALANDDHKAWALRALALGKHVVCEKPLGLSASDVAAMSKAADAAGKLLVEAVWNRWHQRTQRALTLIDDARTEESSMDVKAWFTFDGVPSDNFRMQPSKGGGALLDLGSYAVGMALAALGPGAVTVERVQRRRADSGVDMTTVATLAHPRGRADVRVSFEQAEAQGLEVSLPHLNVRLGGMSPEDQAFTNWHAPSTLTVSHNGATSTEVFPPCDPYRLMVEAVSARVQGADTWLLPLTESRRVAEVLDLIASADA
jgi:predicted dehydrogenase